MTPTKKPRSQSVTERERAPKVRRSFINDKDELDYLHERIEYWIHGDDPRPARAKGFAKRFVKLLNRNKKALKGSIVWETYHRTVAQLENNIEEETVRQKKEIELVEELIDSGFKSPIYDSEYVVIGYVTLALLLLEKEDVRGWKLCFRKAKEIAVQNGIMLSILGTGGPDSLTGA